MSKIPREEVIAAATFKRLGLVAIRLRLEALHRKGLARQKEALSKKLGGFDDSNLTVFDYLTEAEKEERHSLILAETIGANPVDEAKERLSARIGARNKKWKEKRGE